MPDSIYSNVGEVWDNRRAIHIHINGDCLGARVLTALTAGGGEIVKAAAAFKQSCLLLPFAKRSPPTTLTDTACDHA
jgi:hypothetical protein